MMKRLLYIAAPLVLCSLCVTQVFAQRSSSASQVVTFSVKRTATTGTTVVKTPFEEQRLQGKVSTASATSLPLFPSQAKLSATLDPRRDARLALDLAAAESFDVRKNEFFHAKPQGEVVLTVTD